MQIIFFLFFLLSSLHAMVTWAPPTDLGAGKNPDVGLPLNGHAASAWLREGASKFDPLFIDATYFNGSMWILPAQQLQTDFQILPPEVAVNTSNGHGVAVWLQGNNINASLFDGTTWQPFQTINSGLFGAQNPEVAIDSVTGDAVAIWQEYDGINFVIQTARYNGVSWSAPITLSVAGTDALNPQIAINSVNGHAFAVWTWGASGSSEVVQVSEYNGVSWTNPALVTTLTPPNLIARRPQVAMGGGTSNLAVITWELQPPAPTPDPSVIQASVFNGVSWGVPMQLTSSLTNAFNPQVAVNQIDGTSHVVWEQELEGIRSSYWNGTSWSASQLLSGPDATLAQVAINSATGRAIAAWLRDTGMNVVQSSYWNGVTWQNPASVQQLSLAGQSATSVRIGFNANGVTVAAWGDSVSGDVFESFGQDDFTPPPPCPPPNPPAGISGRQIANRFATETDIVNVISWQPSLTPPGVVAYNIYRNGALIAQVYYLSPLVYKDHHRSPGAATLYEVKAVGCMNQESTTGVFIIIS